MNGGESGGGEIWIEVVEWEKYQHPDAARSKVPPWIKNETKLLSSPDYLGLSAGERAILHGLWLAYARSLRRITANTKSLSRQLSLNVTRKQLEALNHAGFITFIASKPASIVQADLQAQIEIEKEKVSKDPKEPTQGAAFAARISGDQRGREHRPYDAPRNPADHIRKLIANGAIPDHETLDAELAALGLNGDTATELHDLIGKRN